MFAQKQLPDSFAEKHFGLVHSLAARFRGRGIEYDELFSAGCVGLLKAANGFDESRGFAFSTYAVPVILGEIKRLFRDGGTVKVSRGLKELSLKATRLRDELSASGAEPRLSDIAARLGITVAEAAEAISVGAPPLSLTVSEEGGSEYDIPIEPPEAKITDLLALKQLMATLEAADRRLLYLRYWENKTQSEAGQILGMSQVQVSRREKRLLESLKANLL